MGSTVREVYRHLTFALAVIALALLATGGPTAAADPPDPYAVPQPNPQVAQAHAQALPAGAVTFDNGTNTGPPPCLKLLVPSVNATTRVFMCALVVRPPGGGSLRLLRFFTPDGIQGTVDLTAYSGYEDCFGASVVLSDFTGTVKAMVNCKRNDTGNGNDRVVFPVDSGIAATE